MSVPGVLHPGGTTEPAAGKKFFCGKTLLWKYFANFETWLMVVSCTNYGFYGHCSWSRTKFTSDDAEWMCYFVPVVNLTGLLLFSLMWVYSSQRSKHPKAHLRSIKGERLIIWAQLFIRTTARSGPAHSHTPCCQNFKFKVPLSLDHSVRFIWSEHSALLNRLKTSVWCVWKKKTKNK